MKKIGLIIFIAALAVGVVLSNIFSFGSYFAKSPISFSFGSKLKGSGNVITQKRTLSGFKRIEVHGVFNVVVVSQKDFGVEIEGDDNLVKFVNTVVDGGTLEISRDKRFSTRNSITIRVTAPNIEEISSSGASRVGVSNLANEFIKIDSSGASKISLEGSTKDLSVELSGASFLDAVGMSSDKVSIEGSGASHASINVLKELAVELSGASSVKYKGKPGQLTKNTSGVSRVSEIR